MPCSSSARGKLIILFATYSFFLFLIGLIPFLGQIIPPLLTPAFSMVIMTACAQVDQGTTFDHLLLRQSFQPPVMQRLLGLGALYVLMAFITIGLMWLFVGGDLSPLSTIDAKTLANNSNSNQSWVLLVIAFFGLLYVPLFWFAAPLIVWRQSTVGKAIFYSLFSVLRNIKAFIVYFLSWLVVGAILPSLISVMLASLIGLPQLAVAALFLFSIVLTIVMYCSCYTSYKHIFSTPEQLKSTM